MFILSTNSLRPRTISGSAARQQTKDAQERKTTSGIQSQRGTGRIQKPFVARRLCVMCSSIVSIVGVRRFTEADDHTTANTTRPSIVTKRRFTEQDNTTQDHSQPQSTGHDVSSFSSPPSFLSFVGSWPSGGDSIERMNHAYKQIESIERGKGRAGESADDDDYDELSLSPSSPSVPVPIDIGFRLLKALGWKEGEPLGKQERNGLLSPLEAVQRSRQVGLGMSRKRSSDSDPVGGSSVYEEYRINKLTKNKR